MSELAQVAVRLTVDAELEGLLRDIEDAFRRAAKSEVGERGEIVRYESLCAALEARVGHALSLGARPVAQEARDLELVGGSFVRLGPEVLVPIALPLQPGPRTFKVDAPPPLPPAESLPIRDDIRGRRLVQARFEEQLRGAIARPGETRNSALCPSGVHNRVLTEVLRQYVRREGGDPVPVPVVYRDGSTSAATFPFRAVDLVDVLPELSPGDLYLRLTLLSIRHTEMDPVVEGAWLRNAEVSRPRPAAETDNFVHQRSVEQLNVLTRGGSRKVRLGIFQTGLETAVVGFFRAVVEFLMIHPGRLEVIPMFYSAGPTHGVSKTVESEAARFESGLPWATMS